MAGNFPIRTPPFDANGNWSRPLVDFFNSLASSTDGEGGAGGPVVVVTNVANSFTPDLSAGDFQNVVMTADSTLIAPTGTPANGSKTWTLIVDNPTAAQLTLTPDASYFIGFVIAVAANTRAQITWTNDENDDNSVAGSSFNNPIPS
jgi:hypothetical protein